MGPTGLMGPMCPMSPVAFFSTLPTPLPPAANRKLLAWFDRHARQLPWRRDRDPYRVWVSEVMLQQTTVAAVAPRFDQFLERFPDVRALAAADEQDVLKVWEGMGYYGRARNLHRAARTLVEEHGGGLPDDPAVWAALPATVAVREVCVVARHRGQVLLARRPAGGRWANMWEFPRAVLDGDETHEAAARKLLASIGVTAEPGPELMTLRYGVTRFRM